MGFEIYEHTLTKRCRIKQDGAWILVADVQGLDVSRTGLAPIEPREWPNIKAARHYVREIEHNEGKWVRTV